MNHKILEQIKGGAFLAGDLCQWVHLVTINEEEAQGSIQPSDREFTLKFQICKHTFVCAKCAKVLFGQVHEAPSSLNRLQKLSRVR
jgi:hypothetical protein